MTRYSPQLRESKERLARITNDPETLDVICAHVANGGTLIDLCRTWDLPFGWIMNWIRDERRREERYVAAMSDRAEWAIEMVLKELRAIGFSDIRELYREDGSLKPPHEWPEKTAAAVSGLDVDELFEGVGKERQQIGFVKKVKLWEKTKALELLGKNMKMFVERVDVGIGKTLEDLVVGSREVTEEKKEIE